MIWLLDRSIATGLLVALVFATLAYGAVEPWSIAVFELIVTVLAVMWVIKMVFGRSASFAVPDVALPVGGLLLVAIIQSVGLRGADGRVSSLSMDVEATRAAALVLFFLLICMLIAANFFERGERLRKLASFVVVFGMALAIFSLIQYFTWSGSIYWLRPTQWNTVFGPFVNRNHYAGYMEMLVPIPIGLIITRGVKRELWIIYGFVAAVMGLTIFVSLSRGGIISLLAGMMFLVLASSRVAAHRGVVDEKLARRTPRSSALGRVGAVIGIVAAIALGVFWMGPDSVINRAAQSFEAVTDQQTMYLGRNWVWRDTLSMIKANPLLGVGIGAYQTAYPGFSHGDGSTVIEYAHNDYLQVLADAGVVGFGLAIWFIVLVFRAVFRGLKFVDPLMSGLALGCGGSLFSILVHSLFDFNLQIPSNALLFLFLSAVVSQIAANMKEREPDAALQRSMRAGVQMWQQESQ
jgi:O-antigen ligase